MSLKSEKLIIGQKSMEFGEEILSRKLRQVF